MALDLPGDLAMRDALAGVRVIDLTQLLPGPMATLRLAQWGAEVLKIEPPGAGDGARHLFQSEAERAADEPGAFYRELNQGKRARRLDLRSEAGRVQLLAWAGEADVLVEGFRPGVMRRLGLGWETLHSHNPRLVMCAITGYGQAGPWALRAGHDINYMAMSGVLEQVAGPEGVPVIPNLQVGDLLGGTQAALSATLAALIGARTSGRGRFVDISMTHELLRHHVTVRTMLAVHGRVPAPGGGLLSGGAPCYGVYGTADGRWLAVGALEHKFWAALCDALGQSGWAAQHWSLGQEPGSAAALALRGAVAAHLVRQPLAHWVQVLDAADCCVTPVLRLDEAMGHELFRAPPG
jgi:crotonobetainyl-CoA:carnitine CoA-transferase CaiB-like acyl-CoA transferase